MDNYFCRYDFHNGQIIQGYCLNSECTSQPQYCQQCLSHLHNQHLQDCKDRNYLAQLIQSSIDSQNDFQRDTKSKIQNLEYITQKKLDYSFQEMEKLKQMQNYFQQESYQNFKKDIHILKKYYQGVEQKKNSDFLSQIDSFSQTLQIAQNDILQEQIEKNQIMAKQQYEKGLTLSSGQHYQKALECFNQAILLDSRKEEYYIAKSNQLLNLNDYRNAIQSCDIAIRMKPQSYLAYCNKGFALNRINLYEEARNCCEKAIQINPNSAQAFIIKGEILIQMNCFLEAITSCDNAIKVNPTAYLALNYKALALIMLGYADEALINCQQSLQINKKNNLDAYLLITFTLNKKSQFQQARIYCDQAIYDEIRSANIYNNKGFALLNLKDYNGAIQCFQEAIKINPQSDEAFSNMGDSLSYLNQFEAAINNYDYAYQISNNDKYKVKQLTLELELEKSQIKSILNY